jgi:NAD(P)-dependent dehydrogenase (short-subunit alcohol dehydrogenase family)
MTQPFTVALFHATTPIGRELALGLADCGGRVGAAGPDSAVGADQRNRSSYDTNMAALAERLGPIDLVVVPVVGRHGSITARPLVEQSEAEWIEACEDPLRDARYAVQAAFGVLAPPSGRGGRIVLVAPAGAISGEAGFVGYTAAAEGARSMTRVVAKAWGRHGITLHWVGAPMSVFDPEAGSAARLTNWDAALGRPPRVREDLAPVIAGFARPEAAFLTATTTIVDGGLIVPL